MAIKLPLNLASFCFRFFWKTTQQIIADHLLAVAQQLIKDQIKKIRIGI